MKFDAAFAAQPPQVFIEALVRSAASLRMICVGHNWAFGKGRAGNVALLAALGERFGFETVEIEPVEIDGELVSSTRIRKAVEAGDFETARRFLGRDYTILGTVQPGAGRGRGIGFPTANLSAHNERFPPNGVYAVRVLMDSRWFEGVANVGVRPTVESALDRVLEVHIFDFSGDRYGHDIEVKFERFLRPEKKFSSIEELRAQIALMPAWRARSSARRLQCRAHDFYRRSPGKPNLEGQCSLVQEHREAVGGAGSGGLRVLDEARLSGCIDSVVDHEIGREQSSGNKGRIGASHSYRGGIDDKVVLASCSRRARSSSGIASRRSAGPTSRSLRK